MPDGLMLPPPHIIDDLVLSALDEDGAHDDVTTRAIVQTDQWGRGVFIAKDAGVVSGLPVAAAAMSSYDDQISFDALIEDGERISAGTELAEPSSHGQPADDTVPRGVGTGVWERVDGPWER